jgi:glycosyltransferase involved in cell wall biosynthesis
MEYEKDTKIKMLMITDGNFDQASARIRAIQYIPHLEKAGFSVCFVPRIPIKRANLFLKYIHFPLMKRAFCLKKYLLLIFFHWDVIFVQRHCLDEFILKKTTRRCPLIFDFDDAIYLDRSNKSAYRKAGNMVKYAHQVIVSTPFLNNFCREFGKIAWIIPTPVETDLIIPSPRQEDRLPTIGWIGSTWTTNYLKIVEPVLQQLSKERDFRFLSVGAKSGYFIEGVDCQNIKWEFGIEPKVLSEIDIGIMPLPDEDYAAAKGGYKIYLYMAAGIPSVASPVGVNDLIIANGENGFLASSEGEWLRILKLLIDDKDLRNKLGQNGRKQAEQLYDRNVCFVQLVTIVKKCI